jgi:hypothetical protein
MGTAVAGLGALFSLFLSATVMAADAACNFCTIVGLLLRLCKLCAGVVDEWPDARECGREDGMKGKRSFILLEGRLSFSSMSCRRLDGLSASVCKRCDIFRREVEDARSRDRALVVVLGMLDSDVC